MRGGRLLAENDPDTLLQAHKATLLEDIFLKLCRNDDFGSEDTNYSDPDLTKRSGEYRHSIGNFEGMTCVTTPTNQ